MTNRMKHNSEHFSEYRHPGNLGNDFVIAQDVRDPGRGESEVHLEHSSFFVDNAEISGEVEFLLSRLASVLQAGKQNFENTFSTMPTP